MNYNPYFPGGGIGMGRVLYDGLVEYEDGSSSSRIPPPLLSSPFSSFPFPFSRPPGADDAIWDRAFLSVGVPATTSQMAKDVTTFLNWAAEPELDERHKLGLQGCTIMAALWFLTIYVKRYKWTPIKARKIRSYPLLPFSLSLPLLLSSIVFP
jgi:ubiquinol-cytochrome c reductase cytochrome c1 subunit